MPKREDENRSVRAARAMKFEFTPAQLRPRAARPPSLSHATENALFTAIAKLPFSPFIPFFAHPSPCLTGVANFASIAAI